MSSNQITDGPKQVLEWKELVWQDTIATEQLTDVLERFATAPELGRIVLEFRVDKKGAQWLIGSEPHRLPAIKDALVSHLPVRMVRARRTRKEMNDAAAIQIVGGHSLSSNKDRITAGIRALYGTVSRLQDGEQVALQLMLGPRLSPAHWSPNASPWLELLLAGGNTPRSRPNKVPVESRERHGFKVHIRLGATGSPARSAFLVRQVFGSFRTVETGEAKLRLGVDSPTRLHEGRSPWRWQQSLRSSELPVFAAWPAGEPPLPLIGSLHPKILAPKTGLVRDPRNLGVTASVGTEEKFALPIQDALFHTVLVGPTGSAKSTVMLGLIEDAMTAGRGLIVFDPKGDLATDVLARVPTSRRDDVVVIDPTSTAPVGFNPLSGPQRLAHVTADSLLGIFESLFKDYWGIRTADVLTAAFLTLSRVPEANLLWLQPLLTNPAFRKKVLKGQSDPLGTDVFWRQYDAKRPEAQAVEIAPVSNKLRQIILRPNLRATLGQSKPRFDIGDVITKRRIVVVNLNRGLLGGDAAKLVGTLLLGQLWSRLLARQGVPVERRHTIEVFIDEVHDFIAGIPGDLSDALAQARSLGGAFTMAHQYFSQLDPAMREAMNANARNKIYFGMNGLDAAIAAKQAPGLEPQDFMQLPKFHAYANILQKGNSTDWVTIRTRPPSPARTDAGLIYAHSHARYGTPAEQTEKELLELTDLSAEPEFEGATSGIGRVKR
ncbi:type IV secretory system conjugative DNA transfer family protein [Schaalia sp. JY-X169]|uniref:type IV secretory system conjugative DNA transfer family protein n=1 Tax=Schaalia sp. JY-X169 TaxID=2758572 RepID=UPI0015F4E5DB|nr:type IV secretory system conjugative DNA transfer family protein [Schaalia sp. JY-X169]